MPGYTNPQNLNRYSYVTNNPLRYTDPTGHMRVEDGPQSNGCSNPTYCQNGEPISPVTNNNNDNETPAYQDPGGSGLLASPGLQDNQLTTNTFYSTPLLPPSPFACGWFDCALSAVSLIASGVTMTEIPQYVAVAFVVDLVATGVAIIRTNEDHAQGVINDVNQIALNGTALAGLIPGPWGFGFSAINTIVTFSGFPP